MGRRSENRLFAAALLAIIFLFRQALFAQEEKLLFSGKVNSDEINLRADSRVSAEKICALPRGEKVEVTLQLYDWYRIRLPKFAPAYVKKDFCACIEYAPSGPSASNVTPSAKKYCRNAKITASRVNIRLAPSEASPVLGKAEENETVRIVKETGEWLKIEPTANCFGWAHKKFITKDEDYKAAPEKTLL